MWENKESGMKKKSQAEVIESGKRTNSDLQGETGRLFVFLCIISTAVDNCTQRGKD